MKNFSLLLLSSFILTSCELGFNDETIQNNELELKVLENVRNLPIHELSGKEVLNTRIYNRDLIDAELEYVYGAQNPKGLNQKASHKGCEPPEQRVEFLKRSSKILASTSFSNIWAREPIGGIRPPLPCPGPGPVGDDTHCIPDVELDLWRVGIYTEDILKSSVTLLDYRTGKVVAIGVPVSYNPTFNNVYYGFSLVNPDLGKNGHWMVAYSSVGNKTTVVADPIPPGTIMY